MRCAFFSSPVGVDQATNYGQERGPADQNGDKFEALMSVSNGKWFPLAIPRLVLMLTS